MTTKSSSNRAKGSKSRRRIAAQDDPPDSSDVRFRSIVETASDAIITVDAQGTILTWNSAATHIFGYTEAEIIGQAITVLVPI